MSAPSSQTTDLAPAGTFTADTFTERHAELHAEHRPELHAKPPVAAGPASTATNVWPAGELSIGGRVLPSRFFLSPLAGYTHLAFRQAVRELGGLGLATTDLVQAQHLIAGTKWAVELTKTNAVDTPLSVQIYGGVTKHLVAAAKWLEDRGYAGIDINMGCPMAKITGQGGGARLMCKAESAGQLVQQVVSAVSIPVTVKMRLGWDRDNITAPQLARHFEELGVAAITIHGRTRAQGFRGEVHLDGIRAVVAAVQSIPVIGNGDVRTPEDAARMYAETGCDGIAIGRGALMDPWIFKRLARVFAGVTEPLQVTPREQLDFLWRHYHLMLDQYGEFKSCLMFRKFVAWYGARLGIPEDLESRLRQFESIAEFEEIYRAVEQRHGERISDRPTIEVRVPNGPNEHW